MLTKWLLVKLRSNLSNYFVLRHSVYLAMVLIGYFAIHMEFHSPLNRKLIV